MKVLKELDDIESGVVEGLLLRDSEDTKLEKLTEAVKVIEEYLQSNENLQWKSILIEHGGRVYNGYPVKGFIKVMFQGEKLKGYREVL